MFTFPKIAFTELDICEEYESLITYDGSSFFGVMAGYGSQEACNVGLYTTLISEIGVWRVDSDRQESEKCLTRATILRWTH